MNVHRDPEQTELRPAYCLLAAPVALVIAVAALMRLDAIRAADVIRTVLVVAFAAAGIAVGMRRRTDRLAPISAGGALVGAGSMLADAVARHGGSSAAATSARVGLGLVIGVGAHFLAALPDGRLTTAGRRGFVLLSYVGLGLVGLVSPHTGMSIAWWPLVIAGAVAIGVAVALSHMRYRRVGGAERRRMKWIGWAMAVWAELALVIGCLHLMTSRPSHMSPWVLGGSILVAGAVAAGTHAGLVARVDHLLTHTVSLAGLTAAVLVMYVGVLLALGRPLQRGERSLLLLSMAAATLATLVYIPARHRLTDMANQFVYGEVVAPDETLRTFGSRLSRTIPLDELLLQMVESLRKSMSLTSAQCWTGGNGRYDLASSVPHLDPPTLRLGDKELAVVSRAGVSGGTWLGIWMPHLVPAEHRAVTRVAPIAHLGELLGLIVVSRIGGVEFNEDDDRVLTELARQVGLALHNAQLDSALQASLEELQRANVDLVESRRRIVTAGDAERRKLERNLHDGAQQYLVAMAVKLRLTQDLLEEEPEEALGLIGELRTNMQDAIGELRALAHGIFPPLLSSGGLAEALPAAAGRAALPTQVESGVVNRYDPEVEASVYFCCMEALQNAGKHAGDSATATITVGEVDDELRFEVRDSGAGFATQNGGAVGHGFVNMTDRLGAIGGKLTVWSEPGRGTSVGGQVPLEARTPANA